MDRIGRELKKDYKAINIIILCICLYLLFLFPIVSKVLENISPTLTACPFLRLTGKPCPLCGGTRFLSNIKNVFNDITYIFNFFGLVILIIFLEIVFRIINIVKKEKRDSIIKFDIITHIVLVISYVVYAIYFICKWLN